MRKGTIFIAEDNLEVMRMYERVFRLNGHDVILSYDGESAQRDLLSMEKVPDAIILDIMMPHLSGLDLLINLRKNPHFADVPIVVLTNSFFKEDEQRFLSAGADLFLIKIEQRSKEVVDKVEFLINNKQLKSN